MARLLVVFVTITVIQAACGSALGVHHNIGVFGGNEINIQDAPYMALLETGQDVPCGGVIIDKNFILTTATCCEQGTQSEARSWRARIGSNGKDETGVYIKIKNVVKYPNSGLKTNICLVELARALGFGRLVDKIPLDDGSTILEEGLPVSFTAYGRNDRNDNSGLQVLRQATFPIDGSDWCKREVKRLGNSILCAGDHEKNGCYGDAGGALTYDGLLVGVLSDVPSDCRSRASRFSRISYYRSWIMENIQKSV